MSSDYVERSMSLIGRVSGLELAPHAVRLLAEGEPVEIERLAAASGWPPDAVQAALDEQTSAERDDRARLVGLALTLRPTRHRFTVDARTLYAWCASDTLMFPVILGRPGVVESTCPQTGRPIRIELTPAGRRAARPARGRRVGGQARRHARGRARHHLRPRALLQLAGGRQRLGSPAPRRLHPHRGGRLPA